MPLLREVASPDDLAAAGRAQHDQRQHDVILTRLRQLECDHRELLKAAAACRRAADHLPDSDGREALLHRVAALGVNLDPFASLRALHRDAA